MLLESSTQRKPQIEAILVSTQITGGMQISFTIVLNHSFGKYDLFRETNVALVKRARPVGSRHVLVGLRCEDLSYERHMSQRPLNGCHVVGATWTRTRGLPTSDYSMGTVAVLRIIACPQRCLR